MRQNPAKMSQETPNLLSRLEKLDLETRRAPPTDAAINPFMSRPRSKSLSSIDFGSSCNCYKRNQAIKHTISFKRPNKKILREPLLKFIKCVHGDKHDMKTHKAVRHKQKLFGQCGRQKECDFKTIIDACENLNLNNANDDVHNYKSPNFLNPQSRSCRKLANKSESAGTVNTSCSHQARMNITPPCDVTIDELASYFETLVHIPKKMSSMAEMMYI